jgi:hypothetical protein
MSNFCILRRANPQQPCGGNVSARDEAVTDRKRANQIAISVVLNFPGLIRILIGAQDEEAEFYGIVGHGCVNSIIVGLFRRP